MDQIIIKNDNGKVSVEVSDEMSWTLFIRMMASTIQYVAEKTISQVSDHPELPEEERLSPEDARAMVADQVNFAMSNVLENICPKDPDLMLSEVAIAKMEDEIIKKAQAEGKTMKEALEEYQKELLEK